MSSNSESESESNRSNNESMSISERLFDKQLKYDDADSMKKSRMKSISVMVPVLVLVMSMDRKRPHGSSVPRRRYIKRDRHERHEIIINDYFKGEDSKYTAEQFRRRFRMDVELFNRILHAIGNYDHYFSPKVDGVGRYGISPLQKMWAALRMLAYGCAADLLDEYVLIGESTAIESLKLFCDAVINIFEEEYSRKLNESDVKRLLKEGEERGFPRMLGSLDCMHWQWKNCPTAWHGTHTNGFKKAQTLILEAVASKDLWIWHAFFGMEGTNNDINVLNRSPLFDDIVNGVAPPSPFVVNGHQYEMGYYLFDGIYPSYATLIQSIPEPSLEKEKLFAKCQEAIRKDVERAFGVLQSRWHIVKGPTRMWNTKDLGKIMKTRIIMHSMIIESETRKGINPEDWIPHVDEMIDNVTVEHDHYIIVSKMISRLKQLQSTNIHKDLKADLIDHLWNREGVARD